MIKTLLPELGGVLTQRRESLWATKDFTATTEDEQYGLEVGKTYTLWVAQKNGTTTTGREVTKGDWFVVLKK